MHEAHVLHDAVVQTGLLNLSNLTGLMNCSESYSCLMDFAQSSSDQTTLGCISKLEIAVQFISFPFKGYKL